MPKSQHHTPQRPSPKSHQRAAKTVNISPKTALAAPILLPRPAPALLKLAEMGGNKRDSRKMAPSHPLVGNGACRIRPPETERYRQ